MNDKLTGLSAEKDVLIRDLQEALNSVKTLRGMLPICSSCKKIRDDKGYWSQIESYVSAHSEAEFSHGICPDCAHKLYPEYYKRLSAASPEQGQSSENAESAPADHCPADAGTSGK